MKPTAILADAVDLVEREAVNDEEATPEGDVVQWIDAFALAIAAGIRVGAGGLHGESRSERGDSPANDENASDGDDNVLTVDDVAALLKIGRNVVYESVSRNELPHRRIGKQIRFSRRGVMRWLNSWSSQGAKEGK